MRIDVYGYVRMCTGVDFCGGVLIIMCGYVWMCDVCGVGWTCVWKRMDAYGCVWMCVDVYG